MEYDTLFSPEDENQIVEAIRLAEKETSGEIRVHIEKNNSKAPLDRALEVFFELKMDKTELRNGVLFYLAYQSKQFAICGDQGIHQVVGDNFWEQTKEKVITQFKKGNYKDGLIEGILDAGNQLKTYFPWQKDDINELSDEISKG